jgi:hypothetical protein
MLFGHLVDGIYKTLYGFTTLYALATLGAHSPRLVLRPFAQHLITKQCLRSRFLPLDLTLADFAREVVHNEGLFVDVVGLLDVFPPLDEPLV